MARDRTKTDLIVIHCAASTPEMNTTIDDIHKWHLARGIRSDRGRTGYHFIIHRDGSSHPGRDLFEVGAQAKGYNDRSVGICLSGGCRWEGEGKDRVLVPENNFTPRQFETLEMNVIGLMAYFGLRADQVIGHNQISSKACPSFDVPAWLESRGIL